MISAYLKSMLSANCIMEFRILFGAQLLVTDIHGGVLDNKMIKIWSPCNSLICKGFIIGMRLFLQCFLVLKSNDSIFFL